MAAIRPFFSQERKSSFHLYLFAILSIRELCEFVFPLRGQLIGSHAKNIIYVYTYANAVCGKRKVQR